MSERTTLRVTVELLADAIPGSGFSIPGGEDIAVCQDSQGYPYLKGSTLKGLLRESLQNWLAWTDADAALADALLGAAGWHGEAGARRVQLTPLTLCQPPADAADCYCLRTFTSVENGVVREGTLRTASCVRKGMAFAGELTCAGEDVPLLKNALGCIRWMGAMRSRGFGQVRVSCKTLAGREDAPSVPETHCIRYRLRTRTPLLITDLSRSRGNSYETRAHIPGAAIRGLVAGALSASDPAWFTAHRQALLSEATRFLDAMPLSEGMVTLPAIKGYYENKEETALAFMFKDGKVEPGLKRAKLGTCCALEGDTLRYWSARTDGVTRIRRGRDGEDTLPFETRYISAGQAFEGYICLDDAALAPQIARALQKTIWLGADRYEGFGNCSLERLEAVEAPAWLRREARVEPTGNVLYLLAISPLTMQDDFGRPCGLDEAALARKLGVERVAILLCATSISEYGGYDRTWASRVPAVRMYDRGSVFKLECSQPPSPERLRALEREGLGMRRAEGYGQVLFLAPEALEGIRQKQPLRAEGSSTEHPGARLRRARCEYIMRKAQAISQMPLSRSQLGDIQALCEKALAQKDETARDLTTYFARNLTERGAQHASRFAAIQTLVRDALERPLSETLGVPAPDIKLERLRLLCALFDHSRKLGDGEEEGR